MKRYVSLAGAMLVGTVVAQEKKAAFKGEVAAVKVQAAVELKGTNAVPKEEIRAIYRSDVSRYTPDVERRSSGITNNTRNSPNVERRTSVFTDNTNNTPDVERRTSVYTDNSPNVERFTSGLTYNTNNTPDVEIDRFTSGITYNTENTPDVERFTSGITYNTENTPDVEFDRFTSRQTFNTYNSPDVMSVFENSYYTDNTFNSIGVENRRFEDSPVTDKTSNSIGVARRRRPTRPDYRPTRPEKRPNNHPYYDYRDCPVGQVELDGICRDIPRVAADYERPESFYSAKSQFEEVDEMMVKIERGYAGTCGNADLRDAYEIGDTYSCSEA